MRVLVTGGRDYNNASRIEAAIVDFGVTELAHGGARGADSLAGSIAERRGLPVTVYFADWQRDGKAAGHIRNRIMLNNFKPDAVIAFKGGKGTSNMVEYAKSKGYKIIDIDFTDNA